MRTSLLFLLILFTFWSCAEDTKVLSATNLQDYLSINVNKTLDEVIACAGNAQNNTSITYIYYYPVTGSSDFRYYEATDVAIDPNDFSKYTLKEFSSEGIFGNKLSRFIRTDNAEAWGIVTFLTDGKLHKSNPIRLKSNTRPTTYTNEITVDNSDVFVPKFTWQASMNNEDAIYFQVIVDEDDNFLSGTYTQELHYQYNNNTNVVLDINTQTPPNLTSGNTYNITILGVSIDNWVNLHLEKTFMIN